MTRIFLASAALAAVLASSGAALAQQEQTTAQEDPVVARVGETEILRSDAVRAFGRLPEQYQQVPIEVIFPQIVQQLVDGELLLKAGRAEGIQDTAEVRREVADFEKVAIQRVYMDKLVEEALTTENVREVYENTVAKADTPLEVRASHILVESREEADEIIAALDDGRDFAALAKERSTGPSAERGGDLGYFVRSQMVEPFADAAFAMEPGSVSKEPVQTDFGWHVINVVDKRRQAPPGFEESRAQIEQQLTRDIIAAHMAELRADAEIQVFDMNGAPVEEAPKQ